MPLTTEQRSQKLVTTREAAAAFLDDIEYLRGIVAKQSATGGEIRRISSILRRLLIDDDIRAIAAPRLGKVTLRTPDNRAAYVAERKRPFLFFSSGRANVHGGKPGAIMVYDVKGSPLFAHQHIEIPHVDPDKYLELSLDNFLTQRVLCLRGEWVTRRQVIKYVANVASGVHSSAAKTRDELTLAQIRSSASISIGADNGLHLELFRHGLDSTEAPFSYRPDHIDPVLIEVLASARFLVESDCVLKLEIAIREELNAGSTTQ